MNEILRVVNISKKILKTEILKGISFSSHKGEILAIIGPNGSGKTTLFKLITGLSAPSYGNITLFNQSVQIRNNMSKVGALIETSSFYEYTTGYNNLKLFAKDEQLIKNLIGEFKLDSFIYDKVGMYSLGMKQRLALAYVFSNNPELVVLDEPTNGLDIDGIKLLKNKINHFKENGGTVLLSSHNIHDVEMLFDKLLILKKGEQVFYGSKQEIVKKGRYVYKINQQSLQKALDLIKDSFNLKGNIESNLLYLNLDDERLLAQINALLVKNDVLIYEVRFLGETLEEFYTSFLERDIDG